MVNPTISKELVRTLRAEVKERFGEALFDFRSKASDVIFARREAVAYLREGYQQTGSNRPGTVRVMKTGTAKRSDGETTRLSWHNIAAVIGFRGHSAALLAYRAREEARA